MTRQRVGWALAVLFWALTGAGAEYEYLYREGETFDRGLTEGLREEGFTSWMRHPSAGKVAVFGRPAGGFLEYDFKGLGAGPYTLMIRCLDIPQTRTRILWDGQDLGLVTHDGVPSTSLRWSKPVGPLAGPGDHVLRLEGSADGTQWPYIDVILLTTQAGYVPPRFDQDFVSYRTAWPMLTLADPAGARNIAPAPSEAPGACPVVVERVSMGPAVLGHNPLTLAVRNPGTAAVALSASASLGDASVPAATGKVDLAAGAAGTLQLAPATYRSGPADLRLALQVGEQTVATGAYPVTVARPMAAALDEYAYPTTQATGHWTADFQCAPELLADLRVQLTVSRREPERTVATQSLRAGARVTASLALGKLPLGWYEVRAVVKRGDQVVQEDSRQFLRFAPVPLPKWEPVKDTKQAGGRLLLNGKPFLGLPLYHSGATDQVRARLCNVVQCWGEVPADPLVQIKQHLDAAQKTGTYGMVCLFHSFFREGNGFNLANIQRAVQEFATHPALLGWDLIDEPDGGDVTPAQCQEAADLLRQLDPKHIVWVNLCQYPRGLDYLASQDLWSYDIYPFPTLTAEAYKVWLDISDKNLIGQKALGTCLQTYVYDRFLQRMPTPDELRSSAWLHVIHDYTWLGYYSYYDGGVSGCLSQDPVLWSYLRALNTELVGRRDVILGPGPWQVLPMDPATSRVEARLKRAGSKWYAVVVNLGREPATVTLRPGLAGMKYRLLIEAQDPPQAGEEITCYLRPSSVRVYEITR